MFDAIGRGGKTKNLSPLRWVAAVGIAFAMGVALWAAGTIATRGPAEAPVEDKAPEEVTFNTTKPPPPPPPPPPGPTPKSTTRPMKNRITKTVVKQEIKPPDPTPPPEKKPDEPKKDEPAAAEQPAEDASVAEDEGVPGGVPGGVVGGVVGGVLGGVVGGTGTGTSTIETVDPGDVKFLNPGDVQRTAKAHFPEMIKRANIPVAEALIEFSCAADGSVTHVEWVSGNELVRDAVMQAAQQARFEARPIAFKFRLKFAFKLMG